MGGGRAALWQLAAGHTPSSGDRNVLLLLLLNKSQNRVTQNIWRRCTVLA